MRTLRFLGDVPELAVPDNPHPALRVLPAEPYVFAQWKTVRVHGDYHVELDRHYLLLTRAVW